MAAGVTQPGGAGTTIYIYDDASSASGTGYTFAEIAAAFPADFVDLGTSAKSYRAKTFLQVGDTGTGTATTTLVDTSSSVFFDTSKTLLYRSTQTTSWNTNLGAKVGSGDQSSGKTGTFLYLGAGATFRGNLAIHGCTIKVNTSLAFNGAGVTQDLSNNIIESTTGASFTGGTASLYNADFTHAGTQYALAAMDVSTAERLTAGGTGALAHAFPTSSFTVKDLAMFGTPSLADLFPQVASLGGRNWRLVRPKFSGTVQKFYPWGFMSSDPDLAPQEMWLFDVKCADSDGVGVASIPVKLTDNEGNAQVDTVTDSTGQLSFGSGITADAVTVADWYQSGGTTLLVRHRSPFLLECNYPTQTGYNSNYASHRFYFNWPGYQTITTTAGSFEDCNLVLSMAPPASGGSTWVERVVP